MFKISHLNNLQFSECSSFHIVVPAIKLVKQNKIVVKLGFFFFQENVAVPWVKMYPWASIKKLESFLIAQDHVRSLKLNFLCQITNSQLGITKVCLILQELSRYDYTLHITLYSNTYFKESRRRKRRKRWYQNHRVTHQTASPVHQSRHLMKRAARNARRKGKTVKLNEARKIAMRNQNG